MSGILGFGDGEKGRAQYGMLARAQYRSGRQVCCAAKRPFSRSPIRPSDESTGETIFIIARLGKLRDRSMGTRRRSMQKRLYSIRMRGHVKVKSQTGAEP